MDSRYKKFITDKFNQTHTYLENLRRQLSDLCFPRNCIQCAEPAGTGNYQYLCSSCAETLVLVYPPNCRHCGYPYPHAHHQPQKCPHCAHLRPAYSRAHCLCLAKKAGRRIIHQLKYARGLYLYSDIKQIIAQRPDLEKICADACLVPIPLHPTKERERGYNQSQIIAQAIKETVHAPLRIEKLLIRTGYTQSQTQLDKAERALNVAQAFALAPGKKLEFDKKYILIDDVFTTGATANACAQVLSQAGLSSIELITLGHG